MNKHDTADVQVFEPIVQKTWIPTNHTSGQKHSVQNDTHAEVVLIDHTD